MTNEPLYGAIFDEERSRHLARPTLEPHDRPLTLAGKLARLAVYDGFAWALALGAKTGNYVPLVALMLIAECVLLGAAMLLLAPVGLVHSTTACPSRFVYIVSERVCAPANSLVPAR